MTKQQPLRVYGHLTNLTAQAAGPLLDELECLEPPFDLVHFAKGLLTLEYEGAYFYAEDALAVLAKHLPAAAFAGVVGRLDVIDQDAWTLSRHELLGGPPAEGRETVRSKEVSLNDVLDKYKY